MPREQDLRARLRQATAPSHRRLEQLTRLTAPDLTLDSYAIFLDVMRGYHAHIEDHQRDSSAYQTIVRDADARCREPSLASDLAGLRRIGILPAPTPPPRLIDVRTLPRLLGASYVLEGSTLGGTVIASSLTDVLSLPNDTMRYVCFFGSQTGRYFRAFVAALNTAPLSHADSDDAIAAATDLFEALASSFAAAHRRSTAEAQHA